MEQKESVWVRGPAPVQQDSIQMSPLEVSQAAAEMVKRITLFGIVACHELRTPLTSLVASLGMLREILNPDSDSPAGKLIDNALKSVEILKNRTDGLQEIVNIRAGITGVHVGAFDMGELIRGTVKSFAKKAAFAGVEIRTDIAEGLPPLQADASRIDQVIGNLVRNALEYAAEGCRIDVRAGCWDGWMFIEVQDYGPGIDPERRMRIFQPSYQEARQFGEVAGMGIGLELCKVVVAQHGGRIGLVTGKGKGCTFTVELPLAQSL